LSQTIWSVRAILSVTSHAIWPNGDVVSFDLVAEGGMQGVAKPFPMRLRRLPSITTAGDTRWFLGEYDCDPQQVGAEITHQSRPSPASGTGRALAV
jgi:hypothetical protein